jgi:hypothetical protein
MSDAHSKVPPANATPAPASTPPAAATLAPPSPLQIGKAFIKQYYQVLSTNPTQITKFYKPNSVISHSLLPSVQAEPKTLADLTKKDEDSEQLFHWCRPKENENALCFDFGRGAIDAQETINGGILLVVTGHIKLPSDDQGGQEDMKKFVQTFFLNNGASAGKKRQFYVHNDVLRFLDGGLVGSTGASEESEVVKDESDVKDAAPEVKVKGGEAASSEEKKQEATSATAEIAADSKIDAKEGEGLKTDDNTDSKVEVVEEAKISTEANGGSVDNVVAPISTTSDNNGKKTEKHVAKEESFRVPSSANVEHEKTEEVSASTAVASNSKPVKSEEKKSYAKSTSEKKANDASATNTNQEKKGRKNKSRGRSRKSRSSSPTDGKNISTGKKAEVPGSWASLVAGGSGPSAVAAAAASAAAKITKEKKNSTGADSTSTTSVGDDSKEPSNEKRKTESSGKQIKTGSAVTDQQPKQQQQQSNKKVNAAAQRTPEATILIKNIPDRTKEGEIRSMFEPYAGKFKKKILGITLLASRGFCFVDFDSKIVVDEIVKDVEAEKAAIKNNKEGGDIAFASKLFVINGKSLDVGRKVPDKVGSGGRGRGFRRSASPGNSRGGGYSKNNRSGGGRKGSPRGGNRSGNKK